MCRLQRSVLMKITKSQLKQIIKEELNNTLAESEYLNPGVQDVAKEAWKALQARKYHKALEQIIVAVMNLNYTTHAADALAKHKAIKSK